LRNQSLSEDHSPIEDGCACYACQHFTRSYIRHLMVSKEILGLYLASIHNLHFLLDTMRQIRESILNDSFEALKADVLPNLKRTA
jgi:queuine tRNA-ribosyltransferase